MFPKLDFSQKIWLGFGIIILLLSLSSMVALYNLYDISDSTTEVNESAVPVLKQSNQIQINLLKLGKLSSSGYNAVNESQISEASSSFKQGDTLFNQQYVMLTDTIGSDPSMSEDLLTAKQFYDEYTQAVERMFDAKSKLLKAQDNANEELKSLSNLIDDAGAYLLDVVWVEYGDDDKNRDLIEGIAGRIDGLIIGLFNAFEDINLSNNLDSLTNAKDDIAASINGIRVRNNSAENNIPDLKDRELWKDYQNALTELEQRVAGDNSLIDYKIEQVEQTIKAREQLDLSEAAIREVITKFDALLLQADDLFNDRQKSVIDTVDLASKSVIIAWIVLIALAWQNFNSMRKSIKKKMADLAKLNSTGEELASLMDQNRALESVLAAMHDQTGVAYGSVFLMNQDDKLEVKASYPPKQVDPDIKPAQFALGEGILGKAAERKKIKFVPNTAKDSNFIGQENMPDKALLCVPLVDKDVLIGAMNFSGNVSDVTFEDSDYEFASSIARLLVTTIKNIRMREVIEEQNRTLEQKVRERTAELRQKNKDIATMMANLHQGLFTITDGGVIHPEYSSFLEQILQTKQIANRNFMDVVFKNTNLGSDSLNQISTAVDSLLGVDEMMFDFNSHLLVSEFTLTTDEGSDKLLELDWVPIVNQDTDEIEKLMVTVRDVTELKALQMAAEEQKRELEIIGQILSVDDEKFEEFLNSSYEFIGNCRSLIEQAKNKDPSLVATLFRNMHTVKGNARTYGFSYITDSVHNVEHSYDELRKDETKEWQPELLLEELSQAEHDIKRYEKVAEEKLMQRGGSDSGIVIDHSHVRDLINEAINLNIEGCKNPVKNWVKEAFDVLAHTQAKPISGVLTSVISSVNSLADQLGKEKPVFNVNDGPYLIRKEIHNMLNNIFMHVLRNAVDHGIEDSATRRKAGKPEQGTISLDVSDKTNSLIIAIQDDGRGLALSQLYASALKKNLLSDGDPKPDDQTIANLIFHSGFSTAQEVSDISGRGVGMDAVKQFLEESGGSIKISLTSGNEGDDYRQFITEIHIHKKYTLEQPEF